MHGGRVLELSARLESERATAGRDEARCTLVRVPFRPAQPLRDVVRDVERAATVVRVGWGHPARGRAAAVWRVDGGNPARGRVECNELELGAEAKRCTFTGRAEAVRSQVRL